MKKYIISLILAGGICFCLETSQNILKVNGTSEIIFQPNIAYITIGIENIYKNVADGQAKINKKVNRFIADIEQIVDKKNIETKVISIQKNYQYNPTNKLREFIGYKLTQELRIKTVSFNKLGFIIDKGLKNGLNTVANFDFYNTDKKEYELTALAKATKNAWEKAKLLAKTLQLKNLRIKEIYEYDSPTPLGSPYLLSLAAGNETNHDTTTPIFGKSLKTTAKVSLQVEFDS